MGARTYSRRYGPVVVVMRNLRTNWRRWLVVLLAAGYFATAWVYSSGVLSGQITKGTLPEIGGVAPAPFTLLNGSVGLDASYYANPADGQCAVVMLHGINADRSDVLDYAPVYWDLGCSIFAFDHRGHGRSTDTARTYGYHEAVDIQIAIQWLLQLTGLEPDEIGLHGISYGAASALEVLNLRDDLGFIVADSPYHSMGAIVSYTARDTLGIFEPLVRPLAYYLIESRSQSLIGAVEPAEAVVEKETPILVIHTAGDPAVPTDHSERVADNNPAVERRVLNGDGVHLGAYDSNRDRYVAIVHSFIARNALHLVTKDPGPVPE